VNGESVRQLLRRLLLIGLWKDHGMKPQHNSLVLLEKSSDEVA
jgi:hypothetical protein